MLGCRPRVKQHDGRRQGQGGNLIDMASLLSKALMVPSTLEITVIRDLIIFLAEVRPWARWHGGMSHHDCQVAAVTITARSNLTRQIMYIPLLTTYGVISQWGNFLFRYLFTGVKSRGSLDIGEENHKRSFSLSHQSPTQMHSSL